MKMKPVVTAIAVAFCTVWNPRPVLAQDNSAPAAARPQQVLQTHDEQDQAAQQSRELQTQLQHLNEQAAMLTQQSAADARQKADAARQKAETEFKRAEEKYKALFDVLGDANRGFSQRLQTIVKRSSQRSQPLIVATTAIAPDTLAEMSEDLSVMRKLIDDATADERDSSGHRAMGINVTTMFPNDTGARTLYIAGQGALFLATVDFPLQPPGTNEEAQAKQPDRQSAWEQARRELYGGGDEASWITTMKVEEKEYSAERVESLKRGILKALANANNFRHLEPDETVTVVIRSAGARQRVLIGGMGGGGFGGSVSAGGSTGTRSVFMADSGPSHPSTGTSHHLHQQTGTQESTMTIRIKKSDADALASGKITPDEFRQRATIAVY